MNTVYLMKDEKREYALIKVGFTGDISKRVTSYSSHNPSAECISHIEVYSKTGRHVETAMLAELETRGYERVISTLTSAETDWFKIGYEDPFYSELLEKGFRAFNYGKRRKDLGVYVLQKA